MALRPGLRAGTAVINATEVQPDPLPSEFVRMEQRVTVAKNAAEEAAQMATEQAGIVQQIVGELKLMCRL